MLQSLTSDEARITSFSGHGSICYRPTTSGIGGIYFKCFTWRPDGHGTEEEASCTCNMDVGRSGSSRLFKGTHIASYKGLFGY